MARVEPRAVHLRSEARDRNARTRSSCPDRFERERVRTLAVFLPDQVVGYLLLGAGVRRLFVFRTLEKRENGAARLPGVRPRVRLLIEVRSRSRIDRLRRLFAYLLKQGFSPSALPDEFYLRVSFLLGGRLPARKVVRALLP